METKSVDSSSRIPTKLIRAAGEPQRFVAKTATRGATGRTIIRNSIGTATDEACGEKEDTKRRNARRQPLVLLDKVQVLSLREEGGRDAPPMGQHKSATPRSCAAITPTANRPIDYHELPSTCGLTLHPPSSSTTAKTTPHARSPHARQLLGQG